LQANQFNQIHYRLFNFFGNVCVKIIFISFPVAFFLCSLTAITIDNTLCFIISLPLSFVKKTCCMKKKLLIVLGILMFLCQNPSFSQTINEGFEESDWVPLTNTASTSSVITVNATGTASINNGQWSYRVGRVQSETKKNGNTAFQFTNNSGGYIITPLITNGVTEVKVSVYTLGSTAGVVVGINTNTSAINSASTGLLCTTGANATGWATMSTWNTGNGLTANSWYELTFTASVTGPCYVKVGRSGNQFVIDDIIISSPAAGPTLVSSQPSLAFGNQQSTTNSASQSFNLSGTLLTGSPGNLTVTAPSTDFQVSNNNTAWGASTTVAYTSATLASTPIYVRFTPQSMGAKSGNVTVAGGGAATINIAVSGTGTGAIYNYRSKQSGNWADASTWEYNTGTWVNALAAPTDADGTINIQNTHTVTVNAATTADDLTIDAGGKIDITTGNTLTIANGAGTDITINGTLKNSGTLALTGTLGFGATGTYQHDATTAIPTLTWTTGSTCLVTGGTGRPSGGFGQSFANLTWNCTNQTDNAVIAVTGFTVTGNLNVVSTGTAGGLQMISSGGVTNSVVGSYTQSGGYAFIFPNTAARSMTCNGDFFISGGGNFGITGTVAPAAAGTGSATLYIKGNLYMGNGSNITRTYGSTANLEFNGTAAQQITVNGTIDTCNTNFNNAAGITLISPVVLKGNTTFTSGLVNTNNTNYLSIFGSATITGGSSTSFVNGPMHRSLDVTTSTALAFPIGKGTAYSPVNLTITQNAVTNTNYIAEAFLAAPAANTLPSTLAKVSNTKYYSIIKGSGATVTAAQVQLNYDATDASGPGVSVADKSLMRITKDNGSGAWIDLGPYGGGTANTAGTVTSNVPFTSFSQFAIANATAAAALPVKFIAFNAQTVNEKVKLSWQVAEETNIVRYEVERAINNNFSKIAQVASNGSNMYTAMDELPLMGSNLYRIKAIEKDGHTLYSMTVKAVKGKSSQMDIMVMPNPVKDKQLNIQLSGYEKGNYSLMLYNAAGSLVYSKQLTLNTGNTTMQVNLPAGLAKGIYQLAVTDGNTKHSKAISVE
jgi:hypothetical protein